MVGQVSTIGLVTTILPEGDNSAIGGVPGNVQMARNTGYRQVIQHDGSQGPAYRSMGKL